jgi:carbamate kinase
MRVVAALGGNALLDREAAGDVRAQAANAVRAAELLAPIAAAHELVITHGNGPQVALLETLSAPHTAADAAVPLDVLDAEGDGMIGYLLTQELGNVLPSREVAALLTRVLVDHADPAFADPSVLIGPAYATEDEAWTAAHAHGWAVGPDGDRWRRVVPSPEPQDVLELPVVRRLVDAGVVVVCAGGGGVPVVRRGDGRLHGAEAVVAKDLTAALLARRLGADALLLLTDVDGIHAGWGTPGSERLTQLDAADVDALALDPYSMGPKAEAAARFARSAPGAVSAIGRLQDAAALLQGTAGTRVTAAVHASSAG